MLIGSWLQKSTSSINDQWERSATRVYLQAYTTDADEMDVRKNSGFLINQPHPSDPGSVVSQIDAEMVEADPAKYANAAGIPDGLDGIDCYWWAVTVTFGPWDPLTHTATGNPVDQPIDVSFQWQVFEQYCDVAYDPSTGSLVPVLNSAGIPFDPPVTREQLKGIMRVAWNSLTFDPATFFTYGNMINSDAWNGFSPGTIKVSPPNMPQRLYSQFLGQNYYRLEIEMCFNPNDGGWNAKPIDRSFVALDGSGNYFKILDVNGQPLSQPALLDGSGHVLSPTAGTFNQFNYQVYASTPFAAAFPNLTSLF
jgi:hypothetical protein